MEITLKSRILVTRNLVRFRAPCRTPVLTYITQCVHTYRTWFTLWNVSSDAQFPSNSQENAHDYAVLAMHRTLVLRLPW